MTRDSVHFRACAAILLGLMLAGPHAIQSKQLQNPPARQSQETKDPKANQEDVVSLKAHLVTTDVLVRDKKGKYITDLKLEDFTVVENGVQQRVEFFDPPSPANAETVAAPDPAQPVAPVAPGEKPFNIVSLLVDGQTTELANMRQVRDGTLRYIRERIGNRDTVALFAVNNSLQLLQPFTQDKAKLAAAVEKAYSFSSASKNLEAAQISNDIDRMREEIRNNEGSASPSSQLRAMMASRALQQFIKLRSQLNVQMARPIIAAIAGICEAQRAIPGKKTLVLFSQGFVAAAAMDWQVQAAIDLANRANVVIYIVDSGGLSGGTPQSGALVAPNPLEGVSGTNTTENRMRTTGGENVFDHVRHEGLNRQQDILYQIANNTGGEFIKGTNDIGRALDRIDRDIRSRYTLAYYTSDQNFDGSFRKLKVEVRRPEATVVARPGYYAIPTGELVLLSPDEKKLLAGVTSAEATPDFPMFVEMSPFRTREGHDLVVSIEVPPSAVKLTRKGELHQGQIEIIGVVKDLSDRFVSRLGGTFDIKLTNDQFRTFTRNNLFFRQDLDLSPGQYQIELILRDKLSGKIAGKTDKLLLAGIDSELSTSGVVLSRSALRSATPAKTTSTDPLDQGGVQVRPAPARAFRSGDNLIVFFELYNAVTDAQSGKPLARVTITLTRDGKAVTRPVDYMLTELSPEPVPHLTFSKFVGLKGLAAGKYVAAIEVRDAITRKLVTHQIPFDIVQ